MNLFSIKCYFRANLNIDVTKIEFSGGGVSQVTSKSDIESPCNFFLMKETSHFLRYSTTFIIYA